MKDIVKKSRTAVAGVSHFAGNLSEFDALLGADAGTERMLDFFHLGDQIGGLDKLGRGVAAGNDDVQSRL